MESAFIHPKAHVDVTVSLGPGTRVWQFASITRGTVMGAECSVSPHAMLDGSVYGDRVLVSAGVACGAGFRVGSDVFLGPGVCLANDLWPFASKDGYDDVELSRGEKFVVIIEDGVAIGAHALILPGVRVGEGSVIAAGACVNKDVPARMLWTRSGKLKPVPEDWRENRMRWAS